MSECWRDERNEGAFDQLDRAGVMVAVVPCCFVVVGVLQTKLEQDSKYRSCRVCSWEAGGVSSRG